QQLGHEDAVLATAFVDDLAETGGRHHQRVGGRHDRGEAGWRAAEPALEGIAARRIDDDELHGAAIELAQYGLDADAVARNIPLAPDLRIDRNHVFVPSGLNGNAAIIKQRGRAGFDLALEALERVLELLLAEIFAELDVETGRLELVDQHPRVV